MLREGAIYLFGHFVGTSWTRPPEVLCPQSLTLPGPVNKVDPAESEPSARRDGGEEVRRRPCREIRVHRVTPIGAQTMVLFVDAPAAREQLEGCYWMNRPPVTAVRAVPRN